MEGWKLQTTAGPADSITPPLHHSTTPL